MTAWMNAARGRKIRIRRAAFFLLALLLICARTEGEIRMNGIPVTMKKSYK